MLSITVNCERECILRIACVNIIVIYGTRRIFDSKGLPIQQEIRGLKFVLIQLISNTTSYD